MFLVYYISLIIICSIVTVKSIDAIDNKWLQFISLVAGLIGTTVITYFLYAKFFPGYI